LVWKKNTDKSGSYVQANRVTSICKGRVIGLGTWNWLLWTTAMNHYLTECSFARHVL
jgi:hypothetical protein